MNAIIAAMLQRTRVEKFLCQSNQYGLLPQVLPNTVHEGGAAGENSNASLFVELLAAYFIFISSFPYLV